MIIFKNCPFHFCAPNQPGKGQGKTSLKVVPNPPTVEQAGCLGPGFQPGQRVPFSVSSSTLYVPFSFLSQSPAILIIPDVS